MALGAPANNIPRLIALHAADYGGKDTTAELIKELSTAPDTWVSFASRGFAVKVKESIAASFGIPLDEAVEWCDELKHPDSKIRVELRGLDGTMRSLYVSGRQFIRDFATAGHRDLFDPNFWVNVLLPMNTPEVHSSWHSNFEHAAMCVITDLRFKTEADRVRALGGEVWALIGRGEPFDADHLSNGDFEWKGADRIISNSGDLEHLRAEIRAVL